jgi:hypothetical protein
MLNQLISLTLVLAMSGVAGVSPIRAGSQDERQARAAAKIRQKVKESGIGKSARVEVILLDSTILKGHISEAGEDSFVVANDGSGAHTSVEYSQVKRVKGRGRSTRSKFLIGLGIAAGVYLALALIIDE